MTATGGLPEFLWQLVLKLRRRNVAIGVDDLALLRQALQLGFGLQSRAALRELVVSLWAKSVSEASLIRAEFEQVEIGEFTVAPAASTTTTNTGEPRPGGPLLSPTTAPVTADQPEITPAETRALTAFPALPRRLGERAVGYHLVPRYPITEREIVQAWRRADPRASARPRSWTRPRPSIAGWRPAWPPRRWCCRAGTTSPGSCCSWTAWAP